MAEVVGIFGVPHSPFFPAQRAGGGEPADELERLWGAVGSELRAVRPDVLLVLTSDHYNNFWRTLPTFAVGVSDHAHRTMDYPEWEAADVPVPERLADDLLRHLVGEEFDAARVQEVGLDHTISVPLDMLSAHDLPVLPVFLNGHMAPLPSATRCAAFGAAIGRGLERSDDPSRVAVVASGSFSLEVGGPRMTATQHIGVPDPDWVHRVIELLSCGDVETLTAEATPDQLAAAGNAGGEILVWIAVLGAAATVAPTFIDLQLPLGHGYAAWPLKGAR